MNVVKKFIMLGLKPETILGKFSIGFILAYFLLFAVFMVLAGSGQEAGATLYSNLVLAIPGSLAGISAVSALITGALGILISRDRSLLVFISSATGLYLIVVTVVEILFKI